MTTAGYRYIIIDDQIFDPKETWAPPQSPKKEFVNTGITAIRYTQFLPSKPYPLTGYETDRAGLQKAAEIFAAYYPKAKVGFVNAPQVSDSITPVLSGFGYAGAMLLINDVLAINPIQVLMREYAGRVRNGESTMESFDDEIRRVAPGVLAEIK